jgi:hypothetical protein
MEHLKRNIGPPKTDEQAQKDFATVEKDQDGNLVGWDSSDDRPATEKPEDFKP